MAENGSSKPEENPSATTPEELKPQDEAAPRQQPADGGNGTAAADASQPPNPASVRTPFSNLSQVDADLALARRLQEQERAYMMLRMNSGVFGSVGGSYFHVEGEDDDEDDDDDEDFDDPELEHDDVEDDNDEIDSVSRDANGNRAEGHLHVSDGEEEEENFEEDDDDVDAFDAHIDNEDEDDDDEDEDEDENDDEEDEDEDEDDNLGVEFDPEVFATDEAYARALQDAEEREMAARLFAIAGIHDLVGEVTDREDRGGLSQDMWEEVDPDELSYEELLALGEVVGTESRGLSADTIASLPSITYKSGSTQNGTNDSCVICRLDYEDGETLTLLSCKHSYHSECINNWLKINKVCPVCSTEVSTSGHS